ncbi:MAG: hypothetical protein COT92_03505 [Candidatus Doudnabacteria bacterium CG10_big_fil_rev_8_21_14_0_10_42_18]|uniref:Peptidase M24 domain-containing protein n=1 Tax=Candidatus Doudnabacteria bacterium CG10_big_fil_rev_8_21_14_0_10_42_18 TaxID=1974552 RepID=A0A2H0VA94_9BACT|nr:MAG: hypothetical protein COT92_03505 [Candidatus Doudnabacteria bacterium CG10_big_fil_rev_8_21_14_0_10_42_18]
MKLNRIKQLQKSISQPLLIKKSENLFYLTGQWFMQGFLLVKKNDVIFFGDGLEKVEDIKKTDRLKYIGKYLGRSKKVVPEDIFTFAEVHYLRAKCKGLRAKIERSPVDYQRQVKDPSEIELIGKSMRIVEKVFGQVRQQLKRKIWTEEKLAKFIKEAGFKLGAEDVSFPPIVASGAGAAVPHHVPSSKKLKPGESIIIDFGFKYKGYCSDFTRTVFLKSVTPKLEKAYNQTERAYLESIKAAKSGMNAGKLYKKSVDILAEKKLDKYFIHSLGHGTGLEIHELPNLSPGSKDIMENGMVFSIEPGVYIPRIGGVRIEDLVYLDKGEVKKFINAPTKLKDNIV